MNIHNFKSFLLEDKFTMNVNKNRVEITNYNEIGHFDSTKIKIKYDEGVVIVCGRNLIISRLMDDSLLIKGIISNIELR